MSEPVIEGPDAPVSAVARPPAEVPWVGPVAAILVLQTMAAFLSRLVPTVAPVMMSEFGWAESWIGYLAAVNTAGSMVVLFVGMAMIRRLGSVGAQQIGLAAGALSLGLLTFPLLSAAFAASLVIGVSYGIATPAGSEVLQRFTPPRKRNFVFSIKQAGVPLGGVMAGAGLPPLIEAIGWRLALVVACGVVVVTVIAVAPLRSRIDRLEGRDARRPSAGFDLMRTLAEPLMSLSHGAGLWRVSIAGGLLAAAQACWFAFTVTYLVVDLHMPLTTAGLLFAVMQAAGVVGRISLGWLADQLGSGISTMIGAAIVAAVVTALFGLITPAWPLWSIAALAAAAGLSVSGWNGVQIAEIAHRSPSARVGEAAAGSMIFIFLGNLLAPALFTVFVTATERFDLAFFGVAGLCLLSLAGLVGLGRHVPKGERE
jgi:MFS family permease